MADSITPLHYAPGDNIVNNTFPPGADGFNLADISSVSSLAILPPGAQGLVYVGLTDGVTQAFRDIVDPFIGQSGVFGFYLADEPDPSTVSAANLKAESDYIHAHFPGAKTFITLYNPGSRQNPDYTAFIPAKTGIDLYGLDPYPVQPQFTGGIDLSIIPDAVNAAVTQGIPLSQIVPVYQAFGGSGSSTWTLPTAAQEQAILATWGAVVPNPAFDYAYAWAGVPSGDTAISDNRSLQAVFLTHNALGGAPCFAEGTAIATARGAVPVEKIAPGEHVLTVSGRLARVRWTGHRRVACARLPHPGDLHPVRIARGALAPGVPTRALRLSPDHALLCDGVLIPARLLVNGDTIRTEPVAAVTYWHVELDRHDVLLAEGAPCESYLDTGNRAAFMEADAVALHPDFAPRGWGRDACAELVTDPADPRKAAAKARLLRRAAPATPDPDLALEVAGRLLRPKPQGDWLVFHLPAEARHGWLVSRTHRPSERRPDSGDTRSLGVAVRALRRDDKRVALGTLREGWHAPERGWRWTDGRAAIPLRGARRLSLRLGPPGLYLAEAALDPGRQRRNSDHQRVQRQQRQP